MSIRVIILDFDGTLIESVGIKDAAFKELFKGYPGHIDEIMRYHISHNATVRFEKFKYVFENILGVRYDGETRKRLSEEFSKLVFEKIVKCPWVRGARCFLEHFRTKVPLYLASASPAGELERILRAKDLKKYFRDVYAIPWVKTNAIEDILNRESVSSREGVFIGDTYEDFESARSSNILFVGRDSHKSFHGADIPLFKDLFGVRKYLLPLMERGTPHGREQNHHRAGG